MQKMILGVLFVIVTITLYSQFGIITSSESESESNDTALTPATRIDREMPRKKNILTAQDRKKQFIQTILPVVVEVKEELDAEYEKAKGLSGKTHLSEQERTWLEAKMRQYKVNGLPCLLRRMHTHPVSLVVAQAALETGWGSSRFFNEANNIFGIWSYHKNEPRVAASQTRDGQKVYVKKFPTLEEAIRGYFTMISGGYAYGSFRVARMKTDNPFELLRHLRHYSELRDEYVARLYYVIKTNKLYKYDDPTYKPMALSQIVPEYVAQKREAAEKKRNIDQQMMALDEVKVDDAPLDDAPIVPCEEEEQNLTTETAIATSEAP